MKTKTQKCRVCGREIETYTIRYGKAGKGDHNTTSFGDSKEGVLYIQSWFCNDCWAEMMKKKQ